MQKHILIVEDETAIRDMVAFALRKAGMEAMHAPDARAAQTAIGERVPDLILLDWMLPGMSGIDLARRLRKDELTPAVLALRKRSSPSEPGSLTATGLSCCRVHGGAVTNP